MQLGKNVEGREIHQGQIQPVGDIKRRKHHTEAVSTPGKEYKLRHTQVNNTNEKQIRGNRNK